MFVFLNSCYACCSMLLQCYIDLFFTLILLSHFYIFLIYFKIHCFFPLHVQWYVWQIKIVGEENHPGTCFRFSERQTIKPSLRNHVWLQTFMKQRLVRTDRPLISHVSRTSQRPTSHIIISTSTWSFCSFASWFSQFLLSFSLGGGGITQHDFSLSHCLYNTDLFKVTNIIFISCSLIHTSVWTPLLSRHRIWCSQAQSTTPPLALTVSSALQIISKCVFVYVYVWWLAVTAGNQIVLHFSS